MIPGTTHASALTLLQRGNYDQNYLLHELEPYALARTPCNINEIIENIPPLGEV
jgi:hypothetical protein